MGEQAKKDWRDGLEQVGVCPHCGVPVYVTIPQAPSPESAPGNWLPDPVYLCACRILALNNSTPAMPAMPPWRREPLWVAPPVIPATPPPDWWKSPLEVVCGGRAKPGEVEIVAGAP